MTSKMPISGNTWEEFVVHLKVRVNFDFYNLGISEVVENGGTQLEFMEFLIDEEWNEIIIRRIEK